MLHTQCQIIVLYTNILVGSLTTSNQSASLHFENSWQRLGVSDEHIWVRAECYGCVLRSYGCVLSRYGCMLSAVSVS